jgi:signal transduction protein with GAF and PtsI domain
VPLLASGSAAGVLVLQRREAHAFGPAEVALVAALAAPVAYALERARDRALGAAHGAGHDVARTAALRGTAVVPGAALGRADVLKGLSGLGFGSAQPGGAVGLAFASLARDLDKARRQIEPMLAPDALRRLRALAVTLEDNRLRDLAIDECSRKGIAAGLGAIARDYARAPYRVPTDETDWLAERAAEIEDLCVLVGMRALGDRAPQTGAILVAERLTAILALAAAGRKVGGVALAGPIDQLDGPTPLGVAIAHAAKIPLAAQVNGLFGWTRPGDRILIDDGHVRVNPAATAVARFRARLRA